MFVPNVRLSTEIVAKTVVTVQTPEGVPLPNVTVETTNMDEIEEGLKASREKPRKRDWTDVEIEDAMLASDDPTVHDLYRFAKTEGSGQIQSTTPKVSATFGYYMRVRRSNGSIGEQQCFYHVSGSKNIVVFREVESGSPSHPTCSRSSSGVLEESSGRHSARNLTRRTSLSPLLPMTLRPSSRSSASSNSAWIRAVAGADARA